MGKVVPVLRLKRPVSLMSNSINVTYLEIWRCEQISRSRCGYFSLEMNHLLQTCASPGGDVVASPNCGLCDTANVFIKKIITSITRIITAATITQVFAELSNSTNLL